MRRLRSLTWPKRAGVALGCAAVAVLAWAAVAAAIAAPIHIAGTGGDGVFIRPTPDRSQPARGWMPEGASPDYNCFTYGELVGNVDVWFSVNYNGVTGYYASYYDDSSYHSESELTSKYGIPKCGAASPPPPASTPAPPPSATAAPGPTPVAMPSPPVTRPAIQSLFFSPNDDQEFGLAGIQAADAGYRYGDWRQTADCARNDEIGDALVPSGVTTLAGWSAGRLGPIYFIDSDNRSRVSTIVLFDPGSSADMARSGACDDGLEPSINDRLATWLREDARHRLIVLAGAVTEHKPWHVPHTDVYWGHPDFDGLWHYYLAGIWNQPFAGQALICDYDNMDHAQVLRDFASIVRHPVSGCPTKADDPAPTAWHP
jgi:hypothetical protein